MDLFWGSTHLARKLSPLLALTRGGSLHNAGIIIALQRNKSLYGLKFLTAPAKTAKLVPFRYLSLHNRAKRANKEGLWRILSHKPRWLCTRAGL